MKHEYPKVEVDDKSIAEKRKQINVKKPLAISDGQGLMGNLWATFKDRKWEIMGRFGAN